MIDTAADKAMPARVASDTPHVALLDLSYETIDGAPRVSEIEALDLTRSVVEVQPSFVGSAIYAASLNPDSIKERSVALHIPIDARRVGGPPLGIGSLRRIARTFTGLVTLPCFWRVPLFSTGHMGILPAADTWGNEALNHVDLGGAS